MVAFVLAGVFVRIGEHSHDKSLDDVEVLFLFYDGVLLLDKGIHVVDQKSIKQFRVLLLFKNVDLEEGE